MIAPAGWRAVPVDPAAAAVEVAAPMLTTEAGTWRLYRTFPVPRAGRALPIAGTVLAAVFAAALAVALPVVAVRSREPAVAVMVGTLAVGLVLTVRDLAAARLARRVHHDTEPALWDRVLAPSHHRTPVGAGSAVAQYRSLVVAAALEVLQAAAVAVAVVLLLVLAGVAQVAAVAGVLAALGAALWWGTRRPAPEPPRRELLPAVLAGLDEIHHYARESAVLAALLERPAAGRAAARPAERAAAATAVVPLLLLAAVAPLWAPGADPGAAVIAGCALVQLNLVLTRADALARSVLVVGGELTSAVRAVAATPLPAGPDGWSDLRGEIHIDDVTLHPDGAGRPTIDGLTLVVRAGEFVAVVGPSGAGKSSLLRLVAGLEQPVRGEVRLDGVPLPEQLPTAVRSRIGFVSHDADAPRGTVRSVVLGAPDGRPDADGQALRALRAAGLADRIDALPMGLSTVVTGGSGGFATGELQLMLLARAYARTPRLLLLDEPAATARLAEHLRGLSATRVVVTHDARLARAADRVVVVEDGAVTESGSLDELLARRGALSRLFVHLSEGESCEAPSGSSGSSARTWSTGMGSISPRNGPTRSGCRAP